MHRRSLSLLALKGPPENIANVCIFNRTYKALDGPSIWMGKKIFVSEVFNTFEVVMVSSITQRKAWPNIMWSNKKRPPAKIGCIHCVVPQLPQYLVDLDACRWLSVCSHYRCKSNLHFFAR